METGWENKYRSDGVGVDVRPEDLAVLSKGIDIAKSENTTNNHFCHTNFFLSLNIYSSFCFYFVLSLRNHLRLMHFDLTCQESQHNEGLDNYAAGDAWPVQIPICTHHTFFSKFQMVCISQPPKIWLTDVCSSFEYRLICHHFE